MIQMLESLHQETLSLLQRWNFSGVLCFSGPHGIGKSFAIRHFCELNKRRIVDIVSEREKLDVKWENVPTPKTCVGILDAPLMNPGDGGFASLKRFLKNTKAPIVVVLDPSMARSYSDLAKTLKCVHVSHDSFEAFKKRAQRICIPQNEREVEILNHCVRGARRNMAYVLNTYRYLCLDVTSKIETTMPYASKMHGQEALYSLLCAKTAAQSQESLLQACDRDGIDVCHGIAKLLDAHASADAFEAVCNMHARLSTYILNPYSIYDDRVSMCADAKKVLSVQSFDAFEKSLIQPVAKRFRAVDGVPTKKRKQNNEVFIKKSRK